MLALIGFVVSVPLGGALLISIGETYPEKNNQHLLYQPKADLVQKKILSRGKYEGIKYKIVAKQK